MTELSSVIRNWPAASVNRTSVAPAAPAFPAMFAVPAPAALGKSFLLYRFVFVVIDGATVEQTLCALDFVGRAAVAPCRCAYLRVQGSLCRLLTLEVAVRHALVLGDDVHE